MVLPASYKDRGRGCLPVSARQLIPAHKQKVRERTQSGHETDLRAFDIRPTDSDFDGLEVESAGDHEILNVETEAVDDLPFEDGLRCVVPEELESALGVAKWEPGNDAHHQVEEATREFAEGRLMNGDEAAVDGSGSDGDGGGFGSGGAS